MTRLPPTDEDVAIVEKQLGRLLRWDGARPRARRIAPGNLIAALTRAMHDYVEKPRHWVWTFVFVTAPTGDYAGMMPVRVEWPPMFAVTEALRIDDEAAP